ncbi:zinc finger protein 862-like [Cyprinus carpio]|uniref:Zinc finger protein 862-like n=1 Tax=Cyprinus carpio TaxID=7962 RepID=A0A9R0AUE9_CYPCA|nr:zinc finger protein 862-like [Cyprinus carpio]
MARPRQTSLKSFFQRPDAKEDTESGTPEASDVQSQTALPPPEKKPKCRAYRSEWSDKFPWLRCEVVDGNEKNMFCSRCEKAGRRNGFTRGSNNLRMSALIEQALEAPDFVTTDGKYCHSDSVDDMEKALEHIVVEQIREKLKNSDFIGIIIDETVNITVNKKLIIYLKLEIKGKVETCFLGNYDVDSGTARCIYDCVVAVLREMDIALSRVIGLGSDGASVMMGRHGGVGALFKQANPFSIQVHCVAHRAALAALDAEKAVENIRAYKNTISSVLYSFYRHSATRTARLRQLTAALSDEDMVSLKQPCAVRWLSLHRAVEAMKHNWAAVAMEINEEAVCGGNTQAQGLLGQIQTYSFIALTHAMADLLPVMTKLNLVFQKDNVNLSSIRPIVQASVAAFTHLRDVPGPEEETFQAGYKDGTYKDVKVTNSSDPLIQAFKKARERYVQHLIDALLDRFPEDCMDLLHCLDALLNPSRYPQTHSGK